MNVLLLRKILLVLFLSRFAESMAPSSRRLWLSQLFPAGTVLSSSSAVASESTGAETFRIVKWNDATCQNEKLHSQRGDLLEIVYEAHLYSAQGPVYDSSIQRGTGQPYQMVLGSGDMLPGVDLGLYDMCPGEIRELFLPPALAYGNRGNRLFRVPPDTPLYWKVQLLSIPSSSSLRQEEDR